ncbi:hypothetical protein ACFY12_32245 [Streptomyces sp. NPDC001339]|uniref:hypothetical protein n=1 Tax=Streptomyces sp. NPDC001339 TaxID=3364563 RepID=UPI00369B4FC1
MWWDAPSEDLPQGTQVVLKDLSNGTETTYKPGKQKISQNRPGNNSRSWEVFYRWKSPEGKTIESERVRVGMTCNLVECWGTGGS